MRKGRCQICGSVGLLTDDHVPPRSMTPATDMDVRTMVAALSSPKPSGRPAFTSVEFRTLCATCNSTLLGQRYDPALKRFCDSVSLWVRSADAGIILPDVATFRCVPGAVARAIVGHVLAADPEAPSAATARTGTTIDAMRGYFLDPSSDSDGFELYLWPFPSRGHRIVRGVAVSNVFGRYEGPIVGDILKFYPLSWWVVGGRSESTTISMSRFPLLSVDAGEHSVSLRFRPAPPPDWPEHPGPGDVLLFGEQHTSFAKPAVRKDRKSR